MKKAIKRMMGSEVSYLRAVRQERLHKDITKSLKFWDEETESDRKFKNRLDKISKDNYSWEEACYG